ncbi:MAG: glutamyl-tRNA amidotransferase [Micavibrio sp.]|nr:glutamyl-tRNA amidotransferase [Micavibrio sp.]|tara:strand:+ start:1751 stop:2212 length:462 start_codon:yes stop_codon:yes gene_type:complete
MLREKIQAAQKEAMLSKSQQRLATIRLIMATLKDRDIAVRAKNKPEGIDDADILSMLQGMIKQRRDSIQMYKEGGRQELADREAAEINIIEEFLPAQLSDDDVKKIIDGLIADIEADGMKDMGKVISALKEKYAGQVDMGKASALVKDKLSAA